MSNFDINKFKDKESDLYEVYLQSNIANENISYKRNNEQPIIFENEDFTDLDIDFFSYLYLEGVHFKQCDFDALKSENTIFHKCSFEDCNFTEEIVFEHSTFREKCLFTNIANIIFINVLLEEAIFSANIITCNFNDSNLHDCNFKTVNLIENSKFYATVIQHSNDDLTYSFENIVFNSCYFETCYFENLIFLDSRFIDSFITDSEFNYVVFQRTEEHQDEDDEKSIIKMTNNPQNRLLNYSSNKFNYCDLRFIDIHHANFENSFFRYTQMPLVLNYCNFEKNMFIFSKFSDGQNDDSFIDEPSSFLHIVNFKDAIFQGSDSQPVIFERIDMNGINFRNAKFEWVIFENGLMIKSLFGLENDVVTRNINFKNFALVHCVFKNEISNIQFDSCDLEMVQFRNNVEFNNETYRETHNIYLKNTEGPDVNYTNNHVNMFDYTMEYVNNDEEEYELQIEAEKERVSNVIGRAIDIEYEIPESISIPNNKFFPQENDETVKIFDMIEGEIVMDKNFITNFEDEYPQHKIIIKKQKNNWYPYLIDMKYIIKFLQDVTSVNRHKSSYLSNIIFICDDEQNEEPSEEELGRYLSQTAYLKMTFFGIQGLLIPLRDIFALINPQNVNKQIFIVENIQFEEQNKGLLSLSYAVSYQSSVNCTNKENITVGELQHFSEWKEMLRTLTTPPISIRAPSATSQISNNTSFNPITNGDNMTPDIINYEGDEEDNDDEEDDEDENENDNGDESDETEEEIVNILNNKRPAEQNDEPSKKQRTRGGKTKKRINKQKNKKTKKQKTKK